MIRAFRRCSKKLILAKVAELRKKDLLPESWRDYRPNIWEIQDVYTTNASEVTHTIMESPPQDLGASYQNHEDIFARMLEDVILCDYYKRDYKLPNKK
jgi:hypothetical protein